MFWKKRKIEYVVRETTFYNVGELLKTLSVFEEKVLFVIPLGEKNKKDLMIITERGK